jgi:hypothetical protein
MADIGTLNPEQMLQQQQILRQQKMAEMLLQQGMQQPQSQMVSGRYVAPSIFQNIAGLANTYMGQRGIERAEQAQVDLAKRLRADETSAMADYFQQIQPKPAQPAPAGYELIDAGTPAIPANRQAALANLIANPKASPRLQNFAFNKMTADPEAFTLSEGQKRIVVNPDGSYREVAAGGQKPRAPVTVGNYLVDENGKVIFQAPEKPVAGQVVETANGPMLVNTRTAEASPIMASGKPLEPKLTSEQSKDITAINQQRATINGAIDAVEKNKSAFGFVRGIAQNAPYGESLAGRFEKPEDTQARAYVFNNVSAVIKERAGTAQSAQELTRINSFLPATTDKADQVISKLKGFNQYIDDLEKGTRVSPSKKPEAPQSNSFSSEADAQKAFSTGKLKAGDKITINGVTGTWK